MVSRTCARIRLGYQGQVLSHTDPEFPVYIRSLKTQLDLSDFLEEVDGRAISPGKKEPVVKDIGPNGVNPKNETAS